MRGRLLQFSVIRHPRWVAWHHMSAHTHTHTHTPTHTKGLPPQSVSLRLRWAGQWECTSVERPQSLPFSCRWRHFFSPESACDSSRWWPHAESNLSNIQFITWSISVEWVCHLSALSTIWKCSRHKDSWLGGEKGEKGREQTASHRQREQCKSQGISSFPIIS